MACWIEKRFRRVNGVKTKEKLYYVVGEVNGEKICRSARSSWTMANEIKIALNNDAIRGENGLLDKTKSLGEMLNIYLENYKRIHPKSHKDVESSLKHLLGYFGADRKIYTIRGSEFFEFRDKHLKNGYCVNGTIALMARCKSFFSFCVKREKILKSPAIDAMDGLTVEPVATFLSEDQIETLRSYCMNQDILDAVDIALMTGMRQNEIVSFNSSWIREGRIIPPSQVTKSKRARKIPIIPALMDIINRRLDDKEPGARLFPTWNGGENIREHFGRVLRKARKDNHLPFRLRFHDLRHTFASQYLLKGGKLGGLMTMLGHSDIATTQIYVHFEQNHLDDEMMRLDYKFLHENSQVSRFGENLGSTTVFNAIP